MSKLILIIMTVFTFLTSDVSCQKTKDAIALVLFKHEIGKTFSFDSSKNINEKNIIKITYLGKVETNAHIEYSILTWARIWGANEHTTGVILLYNNNKYVGKYVLGDMSDLPEKVENNNLIFINKGKNDDCDSNVVTQVNFDKGIPKKIFLKCKEGYYWGIYSYTKEE